MKNQKQSFFTCFTVFIVLFVFFLSGIGQAQIYRYQDEKGVWHYTDNPVNLPKESESVKTTGPKEIPQQDLIKYISSHFPQRNDIETATSRTVAISSPLGTGSGFFISNDGHIITNRHVIKGDKKQSHKTEAEIEDLEKNFKRIEKLIEEEEERLKEAKRQIERDKKIIDDQPDGSVKRRNLNQHESNKKQYQRWVEDFEGRKSRFRKMKSEKEDEINAYNMSQVEAYYAQTFKILIADNVEFEARLITVSEKHDLALLKLDGYTTPALIPGSSRAVARGDTVYAIGNPIKLRNNVVRGVLSGIERGFLKTDARIYPGNSGGPLVTGDGRVIGINTFKQLTYKFEGLGFAIPIETAINEFRSELAGSVSY